MKMVVERAAAVMMYVE